MNEQTKLVLASGSPRRRELLSKMGYCFEICTPDVDEHVTGHASDIVRTLAIRKAHAAAQRYTDAVIIASDTLVSLHGEPLGKPEDEDDARRMLRALSGTQHDIYTGLCVLDVASGREEVTVERGGVQFKTLSDSQIDAYIATGEPMDKAGAYAIQGKGGAFVESYVGSFESIMGLPVEQLAEMLKHFGF